MLPDKILSCLSRLTIQELRATSPLVIVFTVPLCWRQLCIGTIITIIIVRKHRQNHACINMYCVYNIISLWFCLYNFILTCRAGVFWPEGDWIRQKSQKCLLCRLYLLVLQAHTVIVFMTSSCCRLQVHGNKIRLHHKLVPSFIHLFAHSFIILMCLNDLPCQISVKCDYAIFMQQPYNF